LNSGTFASQTAELGILVTGILTVRQQMFVNVRTNLDLKTRTIELEAVSGLLLGFCDAVVEIDEESLQLTEDSRQLSTMLLHGHGMSAAGLAGKSFLDFFAEDDRCRIKDSLCTASETRSSQTLAINARMLDCLGSFVKVELLHIQFRSTDGQPRRLIGMREFQDVASIAPTQPRRSEEALWPEDSLVHDDVSLMFDAGTFEILNVSEGFQTFCLSHVGQALNFDGLSVFDLSKGTGPSSFSRHMQDAINSYQEKSEEPFQCRELDFLGAIKVNASVKFQEDEVLNCLVGTLAVTSFISQVKLTEKNLAMLASAWRSAGSSRKQRSISSRSRSSQSSRQQRSATQSKQGSILALRSTIGL